MSEVTDGGRGKVKLYPSTKIYVGNDYKSELTFNKVFSTRGTTIGSLLGDDFPLGEDMQHFPVDISSGDYITVDDCIFVAECSPLRLYHVIENDEDKVEIRPYFISIPDPNEFIDKEGFEFIQDFYDEAGTTLCESEVEGKYENASFFVGDIIINAGIITSRLYVANTEYKEGYICGTIYPTEQHETILIPEYVNGYVSYQGYFPEIKS